MAADYLTPPAVGKLLGVKPERVRNWIRSGELTAVNLGDAHRPRFRVSQESLDRFLVGREVEKPTKRRRRRSGVEEPLKYF